MNTEKNELKSEVSAEIKAKWQAWSNIKSKKTKALLIILAIGLVWLKIFTTVLTFDWLASFFN
mgnify:CR=1 FL=1